LVISFEQSGDEGASGYVHVGEKIEILGILGTWVSLAERNSNLTLDPPQLTLIHQKRITFVGSLMCPLNLLRCRLFDGVIKGIVDNILENKDQFKLSEIPSFKSVRVDSECTL
jgi:hypothetical protein